MGASLLALAKSIYYLDPWEESLMNFVMSQIYMEFTNSIQSMKKH